MLLFVVLVFAYYAAYDLYLPNDWVPIAAALLVAALSLPGASRLTGGAGDGRPPSR
nr:hypothetical protein GCM10020093_035270 [Planobispora longispora]